MYKTILEFGTQYVFKESGCDSGFQPPQIAVLHFRGILDPLSHKGLSQAHRWRAREEDFETYGGTFSKCQKKFTLKKNSKENKPLLTSQMLTNDSYSADWPGCLMNIDGNA